MDNQKLPSILGRFRAQEGSGTVRKGKRWGACGETSLPLLADQPLPMYSARSRSSSDPPSALAPISKAYSSPVRRAAATCGRCTCLAVSVALLCVGLLFLVVCDRQPSPCGFHSFGPSPLSSSLPLSFFNNGSFDANADGEENLAGKENLALPRLSSEQVAGSWNFFNKSLARVNAQLAAASYCTRAALESLSCVAEEASLREVSYFSSEISQAAGFVGISRDEFAPLLVVVFRGTSGNRNWVADVFSLKQVGGNGAWGGGSVHIGFLDVYRTLQRPMHALLAEKRKLAISESNLDPESSMRVHIVGHSLGGALATLAAADLHGLRKFQVDQLWTFGSPRVGDQLFVTWLVNVVFAQARVQHWRVTHAHDPIVHLPTERMGFRHVPSEVWFPDASTPADCKMDYALCTDTAEREDPLCAARVWLPLTLTRSADHMLYVGVSFDSELACARLDLEPDSN